MVNDKTNINVHRSNGNVVLEKNVQSIVDRKDNQFRNSKYNKQYKKAYEQRQEKTSRISRPCDEKAKARARVDNRKDRRKKKQRSSKNKNTRRYSSLAGKKHCGDVCGCKRSQKGEGHDRLRLQQTRQLKKKKKCVFQYREYHAFLRLCLRLQIWGVTSYIHTLLHVWYEDCEQTYALHLHITLAVPFFINHDFIYVNTSKERKCI